MKEIINPFNSLVADCTPIEFELFCLETLKAFGEKENLTDFKILHNQKIQAHDGIYQIDVLCEFKALNVSFQVLAECKMYKTPVERKVIMELQSKLVSIGANKGIVISTSGFQSGAVDYAKAHGISLIQVVNDTLFYVYQSADLNMDYLRQRELIRQQLPKCYSMLWDNNAYYPYERIYPTREMERAAAERAREIFYT